MFSSKFVTIRYFKIYIIWEMYEEMADFKVRVLVMMTWLQTITSRSIPHIIHNVSTRNETCIPIWTAKNSWDTNPVFQNESHIKQQQNEVMFCSVIMINRDRTRTSPAKFSLEHFMSIMIRYYSICSRVTWNNAFEALQICTLIYYAKFRM